MIEIVGHRPYAHEPVAGYVFPDLFWNPEETFWVCEAWGDPFEILAELFAIEHSDGHLCGPSIHFKQKKSASFSSLI